MLGEGLGKSIEQEILEEKFASLRRIADRLESTLQAFRAAKPEQGQQRQDLLEEAAESVWFYILQREALGLVNNAAVLDLFNIPGEVRARIGPRRLRK